MLDGTSPSPLLVPAATKQALFLGHDGNLSNIAGIFDLHWRLADQPDATPPNSALAFEMLRYSHGERFCPLRLFATIVARRTEPSCVAELHAQ